MSISKIDNIIAIELYKLTNVVMKDSQNRLDSLVAGEEKFTCMNGWILHYLYNNRDKDIFQKDIEREFSINRSTASKIIRLMEKKGLITRREVPEDARLKKIERLSKAKKYRPIMKVLIEEQENKMLDGFSNEERKQFLEYLQRAQENYRK